MCALRAMEEEGRRREAQVVQERTRMVGGRWTLRLDTDLAPLAWECGMWPVVCGLGMWYVV